MKRKRRIWVAVVLAVAAPLSWVTIRGVQIWFRGGPQRIQIRPDITHVTEPLDADGFVDYVAALNQTYKGDLSAEQNAAVWLLRAVGPEVLDVQPPSKYYTLLGMHPLPDDGAYFVSMEGIAKRRSSHGRDQPESDESESTEAIYVEHDLAISGPWSPEQCPLIAEWLETNREPLEHIDRASQCDRFFFPLVFDEKPRRDWLGNHSPPIEFVLRDLCRLVMVRSTRRLAEHDLDGALNDCMVAVRLGRLAGQSYSATEVITGESVELMACRLLGRVMNYRSLDRSQIAQLLRQFDELPPRQPHWQLLDRSDRLASLFMFTANARLGFEQQNGRKWTFAPTAHQIDWNVVLRRTNETYDRIVAQERADEGRNISTNVALKQQTGELAGGIVESSAENAASHSQRLAQLRRQARLPWGLTATSELFVAGSELWLVGGGDLQDLSRTRTQTLLQITRLALLLEDFRQHHGEYPEGWEELIPDRITSVPADPFSSDEPLVYRRNEQGCVVYSVGEDGIDDGGEELNVPGARDLGVSLQSQPASEEGG